MTYIMDLVGSMGDQVHNLTLKKVSETDINKWGDVGHTDVEEEEITGVVEILSAERKEVSEGDFGSGDARVFVDSFQDGIVEGNIIVYQGKEYEIKEVMEMQIGHESHYEVRASRV